MMITRLLAVNFQRQDQNARREGKLQIQEMQKGNGKSGAPPLNMYKADWVNVERKIFTI